MQAQATQAAPATVSPEAQASAEAHAQAATVAAQAKQAKATANRTATKQANAKPATAKRTGKQPAKPEAVAKPAKRTANPEAAAKREAERVAQLDAVREARKLASEAVRSYYDGASLPFKAAADRFADLNTAKQPKRATQRQAAALAAMLLAGDNIKRDGTFTRGAFVIDGRNVQPETGVLSDMLGRVVSYVSGPISGAGQRDAVFKLNLKAAYGEIQALVGGKLASAALRKLEALGVKPSAQA